MKQILDVLKNSVLIIFLIVVSPILIIVKIFEKPIVRTDKEVEVILEEMLANKTDDDLWDDFLSVPIKDKRLDQLRQRVEVLWAYDEFQNCDANGFITLNKKGLEDLGKIVNDFRNG